MISALRQILTSLKGMGILSETDGGSVFVGNATMLERIGYQPATVSNNH